MVRIISQNVRGINEYEKRKAIFYFLRQKADIVCLQETHSTIDVVNHWEMMWGNTCYWSHYTSAARGVCILVAKNAPIKVLNSYNDNDGRYVGIVFEESRERFNLVNLYAPNDDNPSFFVNVFKALEQDESKRIIV